MFESHRAYFDSVPCFPRNGITTLDPAATKSLADFNRDHLLLIDWTALSNEAAADGEHAVAARGQ